MTIWRRTRAVLGPILVAVAVLAIVMGLNAVMSRSAVGPGPDRTDRLDRVPTAPAVKAVPRNLSTRTARISAYSADGKRLTIHYAMSYPDCLVAVVHPHVLETSDQVSVQLERVDIRSQSLPTCPTGPVEQVVGIFLRRPVADRVVVDLADHGRVIPRQG